MKNATSSLIAVTVILALVFVGLLYVFLTRQSIHTPSTNQPTQQNQTTTQNGNNPPATPTLHLVQIPFDYQVKSVSGNDLLLSGKEGELGITNSDIVQVYKGAPESSPQPARFSDLKSGQKLRVKVLPRVSVKLYIVSE